MFHAFLSSLLNFDVALFQSINGLCGQKLLVDHLVGRFDSVQLKGVAFLSIFGVLWFRRTEAKGRDRETLVLMLLAIILSVVVARILANMLPFRERPMFMAGVGYRAPLFPLDSYFQDWSSFPSDTAAVVFAIATGIWLVSRWWGLLWTCFGALAMAARVYFGLHYPGDIVVGGLIGVGVTIALNNEFMHTNIASRIAAVEQRAPAFFYGLLLPFLYETSTLFSFARSIYRSILHLMFGHK